MDRTSPLGDVALKCAIFRVRGSRRPALPGYISASGVYPATRTRTSATSDTPRRYSVTDPDSVLWLSMPILNHDSMKPGIGIIAVLGTLAALNLSAEVIDYHQHLYSPEAGARSSPGPKGGRRGLVSAAQSLAQCVCIQIRVLRVAARDRGVVLRHHRRGVDARG